MATSTGAWRGSPLTGYRWSCWQCRAWQRHPTMSQSGRASCTQCWRRCTLSFPLSRPFLQGADPGSQACVRRRPQRTRSMPIQQQRLPSGTCLASGRSATVCAHCATRRPHAIFQFNCSSFSKHLSGRQGFPPPALRCTPVFKLCCLCVAA